MKYILSYWDISLGLLAIGFGIFLWIRVQKYIKKRDKDILKKSNGKWELSNARLESDSFLVALCCILIIAGIVFIYNRLNGNLPNIITLIKEFSTY